jgi:hypothetical protein
MKEREKQMKVSPKGKRKSPHSRLLSEGRVLLSKPCKYWFF